MEVKIKFLSISSENFKPLDTPAPPRFKNQILGPPNSTSRWLFSQKKNHRICVKCDYAAFLGFKFFDFEGGRKKIGLDQSILYIFYFGKSRQNASERVNKHWKDLGHVSHTDSQHTPYPF